jgi:hypothetical protein
VADLTADQEAWLRDHVGDDILLTDLQERYDRLDSIRDVAISVIRDRRTALIQSPLKVNLSSVASIDNAENVKAMERTLAELSRLDDDPLSDPHEDISTDTTEHYRLVRARGR